MSSKEIRYSYERINLLVDEINEIKRKSIEIQKRYNFIIPNYILDEIIRSESKSIKDNISALVNLAVVSNRITIDQGIKLKEDFGKNS